MNTKITAAEEFSQTAAVRALRLINSDIEIINNKERLATYGDAIKNIDKVTEKSISGIDGLQSVNGNTSRILMRANLNVNGRAATDTDTPGGRSKDTTMVGRQRDVIGHRLQSLAEYTAQARCS